jgi:hypothetical protein
MPGVVRAVPTRPIRSWSRWTGAPQASRPHGTGAPMLTRLLTGRTATPRYKGVQDGRALRRPPSSKPGRAWRALTTTRRMQFRFRYAIATSPPDSCPRGGGHRRRASPSGRGGANDATVYEGHPRWPCHKRAIHSSPERSRADNHGQPRSSLHLRRSPSSQVAAAPDLALGAGGGTAGRSAISLGLEAESSAPAAKD